MRLASWLLVGLAASLSPGCTCGSSESAGPPAPSAKPAVPAPKGLAAEVVVPQPSTLLRELRAEVGGPLLLMPKTLGGLVINLFGLPLSAAELVDEKLPLFGATIAGEDGQLHNAVAVHVVDGGRLVARLSTGPDATFDVKTQGDLRLLLPKPTLREARLEAPLAVIDNYLVAGDDEQALIALGPYLARTAPKNPLPGDDLVISVTEAMGGERMKTRVAALKGPLKALKLPPAVRVLVDADAWIDGTLEVLSRLGAGGITVNVTPGKPTVVDANLAARDVKAKAELSMLPTSKPDVLAAMIDDAVAGASWSRLGGSAESTAARVSQVLGLDDEDRAAMAEALGQMSAAQGPNTRLALRCTGVGLTGMAEGEAKDADALREGLDNLLALRKRKSVAARLEGRRVGITVKTGRARHIPHDVHLVRIERLQAEGDEEEKPSIDLRWVVEEGRYYAAAGLESLETLQHLHAPDPERRWASKPTIEAALGRMPSPAWLSVVIDPQGANACLQGKPGGTHATPLTLSVAPTEIGARLRLEIAPGLLKVLGKRL